MRWSGTDHRCNTRGDRGALSNGSRRRRLRPVEPVVRAPHAYPGLARARGLDLAEVMIAVAGRQPGPPPPLHLSLLGMLAGSKQTILGHRLHVMDQHVPRG